MTEAELSRVVFEGDYFPTERIESSWGGPLVCHMSPEGSISVIPDQTTIK